MKYIVSLLCVLSYCVFSVFAQPTDEFIQNAIKAAITDVTNVAIGEKNTDSLSGNAMYTVTILRNNKLVQRNETIQGKAIFKKDKNGDFTFEKLKHQVNQFDGIAQISIDDIKAVIVKNHAQFFGDDLHSIVNLIQHPQLTEDVFIYWHSLDVVEVNVKYRVQIIKNNTETDLSDKVITVSLLKKENATDWNYFTVKPLPNHPENKVYETQQFTEEQIKGFRNRTLDKVHYWLKY